MAFHTNFKRFWDQARSDRLHQASLGRIVIESPFITKTRRVQVCCPFTLEFKSGAAELSGRWRPRSGVWTFPAASGRLVVELCQQVYGKDAITMIGFPEEK